MHTFFPILGLPLSPRPKTLSPHPQKKDSQPLRRRLKMVATLRCKSLFAAGVILGAMACTSGPALAKDWFPYPVEQWDPAFDMSSPRKKVEYTPLPKASKKWSI